MSASSHIHRQPSEAGCGVCGRVGGDISRALGVCRRCIVEDTSATREAVGRARERARSAYSTPPSPPRTPDGRACRICVNRCCMGPGELGFCGLRENSGGRLHSRAGTGRLGVFTAYHDPLPTNCVADWVCPGCSASGYPDYSYSRGPERGRNNLAVFLAACSFDCLFCQNWSFRENTEVLAPLRTPAELADMVDDRTSCICFFGGDPSPQLPFALAAARPALDKANGRVLRICWETNGSANPGLLRKALALSIETGGCVKFDIKAWSESLHLALTGATNRRTLENVELAVGLSRCRPEPPPVVASTLMVPGYVGPDEVGHIARFLASLDPDIPYSLLAFHPDYLMDDMGTTTAGQARECEQAAREAGLRRVKRPLFA
jgi:pyruvate formate lyase activating enzyme